MPQRVNVDCSTVFVTLGDTGRDKVTVQDFHQLRGKISQVDIYALDNLDMNDLAEQVALPELKENALSAAN